MGAIADGNVHEAFFQQAEARGQRQRVQQEMVNSLKDLVRLGRDQLAALKDIQNEDSGATFQ